MELKSSLGPILRAYLPSAFEYPCDNSQTQRHKNKDCQQTGSNRDICNTKKTPAKARNQIYDWIKQRYGLPERGQHRN